MTPLTSAESKLDGAADPLGRGAADPLGRGAADLIRRNAADLIRRNAAWWEDPSSEARDHPVRLTADSRAAILAANRRFREETLVALNRRVITISSQDGTCGEEYTPVVPEFIRQEVGFGRLPADFPAEGTVGRETQRPYLELLASREQATALRARLDPTFLQVVAEEGATWMNLAAAAEAARRTSRRIVLTKVGLRATNGWTTLVHPTGFCPIEYLSPVEETKSCGLWCVAVIHPEWGADGEAFLQEILRALPREAGPSRPAAERPPSPTSGRT